MFLLPQTRIIANKRLPNSRCTQKASIRSVNESNSAHGFSSSFNSNSLWNRYCTILGNSNYFIAYFSIGIALMWCVWVWMIQCKHISISFSSEILYWSLICIKHIRAKGGRKQRIQFNTFAQWLLLLSLFIQTDESVRFWCAFQQATGLKRRYTAANTTRTKMRLDEGNLNRNFMQGCQKTEFCRIFSNYFIRIIHFDRKNWRNFNFMSEFHYRDHF